MRRMSDSKELRREIFWHMALDVIAKMLIIIGLGLALSGLWNTAEARDWNVEIFGVDITNLEGRSYGSIILGAVGSIAAHEAGHFIHGQLYGAHPRFRFDRENPTSLLEGRTGHWTDAEFNWQGRAGWISQALIGSALTALPATRGHDFTYGFTATSTAYGLLQAGAPNGDASLTSPAESAAWAGLNTMLTIVNRKEK